MFADRRRGSFALPIAALALAATLLVPVSFARTSAPSAATAKTVNVKAGDKGFTLSAKTAPVGKVTFVVKNTGKLSHDFKIAAKKTPVLKPGKTARLVVAFKKAGPFRYVSTVKGDVARGLAGTFRLTAPPKPATPGNAALGKSVFVANCGTCHVLKAAGTRGTIGPNLDTKPLTYAALAKIITDGKSGTAMAAFKGTLTQAQIENVSAFVYASTH